MKTSSALLAACSLCTFPVFADQPQVHGDPLVPIGSLDVNKEWVRTGVRPELTWNIEYPTSITDLVTITPEDRIIPNVPVEMRIRVVGAAFQVGSLHTPLAVQTRVGSGSPWLPIFLGQDYTVSPTSILYSAEVPAGTPIDFSARAQNSSGGWYSSRNTLTDSVTVTALTNGEPVPNYVPAYEQGDIASFLSQYISSNNIVTIGPNDVIYLFELYSTNPSSSYFDMQDMVVLVSFEAVEDAN